MRSNKVNSDLYLLIDIQKFLTLSGRNTWTGTDAIEVALDLRSNEVKPMIFRTRHLWLDSRMWELLLEHMDMFL